jgi:hypothetical protein
LENEEKMELIVEKEKENMLKDLAARLWGDQGLW